MPGWRFRQVDDFPQSFAPRIMLAGRLRPHGWGRFFLPNVLLVELPLQVPQRHVANTLMPPLCLVKPSLTFIVSMIAR